MSYITKTEGSYFFNDIIPEVELYPARWIWVFFHPEHNPEHQHVALFLRLSEFMSHANYDCYHFGIDKAMQFLELNDHGPLHAIKKTQKGDTVYIYQDIGELADGQEPDGYGSCYAQRWYSYSTVEFEKMVTEFKSGMKEMGWSR